MATYVGESKQQLQEKTIDEIRQDVEKDAWISLRQYFCGAGNGTEAKVACVVVATVAKHEAAMNNARSLNLMERKLQSIEGHKPETKAA